MSPTHLSHLPDHKLGPAPSCPSGSIHVPSIRLPVAWTHLSAWTKHREQPIEGYENEIQSGLPDPRTVISCIVHLYLLLLYGVGSKPKLPSLFTRTRESTPVTCSANSEPSGRRGPAARLPSRRRMSPGELCALRALRALWLYALLGGFHQVLVAC